MSRPDRKTGSNISYSQREVCWFFNVPVNHFREEKRGGAYGLSSFPEKTRMFYKYTLSKSRQQILLNYFTTLSVCPVWSPTLYNASQPSANRQNFESGFHFPRYNQLPFRFPNNLSPPVLNLIFRKMLLEIEKNVFVAYKKLLGPNYPVLVW